MITIEQDADIFEKDFGVTATFTTDGGPVEIVGIFTGGTKETMLYGQIAVEAANPSFTVTASNAAQIKTKNPVTINSTNYRVQKIEDLGTGHAVIWLQTLS